MSLALDNITFAYETTPILLNATLQLSPGTFNLVLGPTGCGKSTLLKIMAGLAPKHTGGRLLGFPFRHDKPIGYVPQAPQDSFVQTTVEEELAFSMEQHGVPPENMRHKMELVLDELGIANIRNRALSSLSGGQQQRVAIGAAIIMGPDLLILDEPTSQLDPTAADEVLGILRKLCHDLGITILIAEHRLERVLHMADAFHLVSNRKILTYYHASALYSDWPDAPHPPVVDLGRAMESMPLPTSVREARRDWLTRAYNDLPPHPKAFYKDVAVFTGLINKENKRRGFDIDKVGIPRHRVTVLMGRNGAGKSTLLHAIADSSKENVRLVPQNASDLFFNSSIGAELRGMERPRAAFALFKTLSGVEDDSVHPRDLSAGQQLALALAIQLTDTPEFILLDEPTRGLDYAAKASLANWLRAMKSESTILVATHDQEFASLIADYVMVIADMELLPDIADAGSALMTQVGAVTNGKYLTVDQFTSAVLSADFHKTVLEHDSDSQ